MTAARLIARARFRPRTLGCSVIPQVTEIPQNSLRDHGTPTDRDDRRMQPGLLKGLEPDPAPEVVSVDGMTLFHGEHQTALNWRIVGKVLGQLISWSQVLVTQPFTKRENGSLLCMGSLSWQP